MKVTAHPGRFPAYVLGSSSYVLLLGLILGVAAPAADAQEPAVRIGLAEGVSTAMVATSVSGVILDATGHALARTTGMEAWRARREGNALILSTSTARIVATALPVRFVPRPTAAQIGLVYGTNRWYRGELELQAYGGRLTLVNRISLEQYLYGVIPAEMNPSWPLESLKAQAVAARTYALAKLGQFSSRGYDLRPTTENQVYRGAAVETQVSNMAVDQTLGQVLTHDGRIIPAYFHSCSGGYTETSAAVWGEPHPYLQAVPDFDQASPRYLWQKNVPAGNLRTGLSRVGVNVGEVLSLQVRERSYSGRVQRIQVIGSAGQQELSGDKVRQAAGLYSTLYNVVSYGGTSGKPAAYAFAGRGHGHGLGLSQWGAKSLAERGYGYAQILSYYYPATQLSSVQLQGGMH